MEVLCVKTGNNDYLGNANPDCLLVGVIHYL